MSYHHLLKEQLTNYFPKQYLQDPLFENFLLAVNDSYSSNDREQDKLNRAFTLTENEYKMLYESLETEYKLKKLSIEKLKDAVKNIDKENELKLEFENNDLLVIVDYLNAEINKRKETQENLNHTLQLLITLLSKLHSGILVEDEERKVLFTNPSFCNMFNVSATPDQLKGTDFSRSADQSKHLFKQQDDYTQRVNTIIAAKETVLADVLYLNDGRILERDYIPIQINTKYKVHLWKYIDVTTSKTFEKKLIDLSNIQEAILNGIDYAIIFTDSAGVIKSFNKGAGKMLGYSSKEVVDVTTLSVFHDQLELEQRASEIEEFGYKINSVSDVLLIKAKANLTDTNEWSYIPKDGKRLTVQLSVSPIKNSENEIIGYLGIANDITEQKAAQKALVESEERYRGIVEKSTDIIYRTNEEGFFTFANAVAERITGYSKEELLKKRYTELIRDDKRKEAIHFYVLQLHHKKTTTYYEFPIITKSGEERWIGQSVQLSEVGNEEYEFTALAIDVTERIGFEKNIRLQKEKYHNIITNMNLGLLEVDMEENIQFSNPGFTILSGYKTAELVGKKASELFVHESHKTTVGNKTKQRLNGVADMYEVLVKNKQGEERWWMISGAPNYDDLGRMIGSIGIHLDITEKKKLEEALEIEKEKAEASSRAKAAFLATMSHEIRTPLNGIIGMIRELSYEPLIDKQKKYVQNASIASQHLLSVLNNVLDISKIEAGELSLEKHHFSLKDTVKDVKVIMATKAKEKNIFFGVDTNDIKNNAYIGDSARIRQVLLNLIGNALKFTSKGGVYVECKIKQVKDGAHTLSISVEDTGIGMDESYQDNLFKKFSQEDSSTSRKYGGTGLGMAITNEIIQLMNGSIHVKSKKNEGTVIEVIFDLPVGELDKIESYNELEVLKDISGTKILLVEDNEFNRASAINTLNRFQCEVTEAFNGKEAIDILKENKFDIILMDLQMPVMDGFEATQLIRNDLKLATPVIALTANAFKSELEKCFAIGMNDCVTKPFEEDDLLNAISKFIKQTNTEIMTIKEAPIKQEEKTCLYDLQKLSNMVRNDKEQLQKMVRIFIDQANPSVTEINNAYTKKDLITVYQVAHRIKPSIDGMGIISLKDVVRTIEKDAKENNDSQLLQDHIKILSDTLNAVVIQLNQNEI